MSNPPGLVDEMLAVLPCPFCEATDAHNQSDYGDENQFVCAICDARGPMRRSFANARAAWNTRDLHTRLAQGGGEDGLDAVAWAINTKWNDLRGDLAPFTQAEAEALASAAMSATQQQREGGVAGHCERAEGRDGV